MATKAMNFKFNESEIKDMKEVAEVYDMTVTDLVRNAVNAYISQMKSDPFYRLTVNVGEASSEETEEILALVDGMNDDDLKIVKTQSFTL